MALGFTVERKIATFYNATAPGHPKVQFQYPKVELDHLLTLTKYPTMVKRLPKGELYGLERALRTITKTEGSALHVPPKNPGWGLWVLDTEHTPCPLTATPLPVAPTQKVRTLDNQQYVDLWLNSLAGVFKVHGATMPHFTSALMFILPCLEEDVALWLIDGLIEYNFDAGMHVYQRYTQGDT